MPIYEKPDSPHWWASYTDATGKRVRRSTGVPRSGGAGGKKEAEALLGKWTAEVHGEKMWGREPAKEVPAHTFDDVMMRYFQDRVPAQRAGLARAKSTARQLYRAFAGCRMAGISEADVKAYSRHRQEQGAAAATINKEMVMLCAACNHAKSLGWDVGNPAGGKGKKLREPEGRDRWLKPEEAARLVDAVKSLERSPWLADFITLALNTAARAGELLWLEWRHVDLQARTIRLERTKSGKRRTIPLNGAAWEAILARARYRAGCEDPASPWVFCKADGSRLTTVKRSFATACRLAGIEDFRVHDLRHSAATAMVRGRVPIYEVGKVLGHASVKTTQRYAHHDPDSLRGAVGAIELSRYGHGEGAEIEEKPRKSLK